MFTNVYNEKKYYHALTLMLNILMGILNVMVCLNYTTYPNKNLLVIAIIIELIAYSYIVYKIIKRL